jgi:hypothetical protein
MKFRRDIRHRSAYGVAATILMPKQRVTQTKRQREQAKRDRQARKAERRANRVNTRDEETPGPVEPVVVNDVN